MTTTAKLGITVIEQTDHVVGTSVADGQMFKINDGFQRVDDQIGAVVCTSGTRPSSPYAGQPIYETDTRNLLIRNVANTTWIQVNTGIPVVATTGAVSSPFTNMIVYDVSFPGLKRYTGSVWVMYDPNTMKIYKATTETVTSSTTVQADNDFFWSLPANSAWALTGYLPIDGAQTPNGGFKSNFTGPAGASAFWTNFGSSTEATTTDYNMVAQGFTTTRNVSTQLTATATMTLQPKGTFVIGGTAGSVAFNWAQAAGHATGTRLLGGAWMKLERLA